MRCVFSVDDIHGLESVEIKPISSTVVALMSTSQKKPYIICVVMFVYSYYSLFVHQRTLHVYGIFSDYPKAVVNAAKITQVLALFAVLFWLGKLGSETGR